jgi:hypothetical protein
MWREFLSRPKFLIPAVFLLWLMVSLPLSVSEAATVNDRACNTTDPTEGVWGQGDSPVHLTALNACYKVSGTMVWGEWWRDKLQDCDRSSPESAYSTCSDSDMNWYIRLSAAERAAAGVTSGEVKKLQRWSQCKAGQRDKSKWCNFLTETIPEGGNYGDSGVPGDPTDDAPLLPHPCLDKDWGGQPITVPSCKGREIYTEFTGTLAKDNNHGWKEAHPVRKEYWTGGNGGSGPHTCSAYSQDGGQTWPDDVSCPRPSSSIST